MSQSPPSDLTLAAHILMERDLYGLLWLDETLTVTAAIGRLVASVRIGASIADSMAAFVGLEDDLRALRDNSREVLALPDITEKRLGASDVRLAVTIEWEPSSARYLVLVSHVMNRGESEVELARQMRLRLIAEAELSNKSRQLERVNQELALANQDLEEFAYVISHDLRAPLRALRYLASDTATAMDRGSAPGDAHVLLQQFTHQIARMNEMMTGLLEYARLGRKSDIVEHTDTGALARSVIGSFGDHTGVSIEIEGAWPVLDTLAAPLDLTLRNLIDNAIKHHDRDAGRVVVSARPAHPFLEITVADDGPGVADEWRDAIFQPFRKAGSEATEGAGIGLALVRKAVDRIGGSIEVKSEAPQTRGTTFVVRWPMAMAGSLDDLKDQSEMAVPIDRAAAAPATVQVLR